MTDAHRAAGDVYLSEAELLELPLFKHLKPKTLAKWRSSGKGPPFSRIGRKVFYRAEAVDVWIREREQNTSPSTRRMPASQPGSSLSRPSRFGRRKTKSDRRTVAGGG